MKNKRLNTRKLRYVFYILLLTVLYTGCTKTVTEENIIKKQDTIYVEFDKYKIQDSLIFDITNARFTDTSTYGRVSEGSCLFNWSNYEDGYLIKAKVKGRIIEKRLCKESEINKVIEDIKKYKYLKKDEVCKRYEQIGNGEQIFRLIKDE